MNENPTWGLSRPALVLPLKAALRRLSSSQAQQTSAGRRSSRLRGDHSVRRFAACLCCLTLASVAGAASDPRLVIQNAALRVEFDPATSRFALTDRVTHRTFVRDGRLSGDRGVARVVTVTDRIFGRGQAIDVVYPDGNGDGISVYRNLRFALVCTRLHNGRSQPAIIRSLRTVSVAVNLDAGSTALKVLGTGGLLAPDQNPGSYGWLAVAEPRTRRGVVAGWLTFNRGSGVVFSAVEHQTVGLEARIDYGRLRLDPGRTESLETFALGYFDDARLGLEAWADAVARVHSIRLPPQPAGYCSWYSRPNGGASDERHLAENAAFAAKTLAPFGFSVVQIDDGWQAGISTNGPKRNFTTHNPRGPYPSGMRAAASGLRALGLIPGLWFMPFAGTDYDPFFKPHPDWFVKRDDGTPYETDWGGTCLDLTQPEVLSYLRDNVERIARTWGFGYIKMDGLWTGTATKQVYVNSGYHDDGMGDAVFHDPEKTNLQAYRDGLKTVRAAVGTNVFLLGCCSPQNMRSYGPAFGLVDAMRIGPDNGPNWRSLLNGPRFGSRQYFLHGRVWYNDPDPVYVRPEVPLAQARLICSWVTLSGQMNFSSEWYPALPPDRLDLLKRTLPSHGLCARPVDLFEEPLPRLWLLTDTRRSPRRDVIGLFNWDDHEYQFDYPLDRIGLERNTEYVAFEYWNNARLPLIRDRLQVSVPARSCAVLALRPRLDRPELVSTSRHVTQGIVDVLEETWHPLTQTLSGRSRVVGHDPYELRIAALSATRDWRVVRVEVTTADGGQDLTCHFTQTDGVIRVTIQSESSRAVAWRVKFGARAER
ncbi:MAG: alpha-galactosidase [Verrucomicrobia bacterium]|nr:alpha-galactosidase [Verrucomicrobiota bacterium]